MSRKRPTSSGWDSDDELLDDTFGQSGASGAITAFPNTNRRLSEDELDEDMLLGNSDDENGIRDYEDVPSSSKDYLLLSSDVNSSADIGPFESTAIDTESEHDPEHQQYSSVSLQPHLSESSFTNIEPLTSTIYENIEHTLVVSCDANNTLKTTTECEPDFQSPDDKTITDTRVSWVESPEQEKDIVQEDKVNGEHKQTAVDHNEEDLQANEMVTVTAEESTNQPIEDSYIISIDAGDNEFDESEDYRTASDAHTVPDHDLHQAMPYKTKPKESEVNTITTAYASRPYRAPSCSRNEDNDLEDDMHGTLDYDDTLDIKEESSESESEDEDSCRDRRFKSERQDVEIRPAVNKTRTDIPDTLEITEEEQKKIDEFVSKRGSWRGGARGRGRPYRGQGRGQYNRPHPMNQLRQSFQGPIRPPLMNMPPPDQSGQNQFQSVPTRKILINPHFRGPTSHPQPWNPRHQHVQGQRLLIPPQGQGQLQMMPPGGRPEMMAVSSSGLAPMLQAQMMEAVSNNGGHVLNRPQCPPGGMMIMQANVGVPHNQGLLPNFGHLPPQGMPPRNMPPMGMQPGLLPHPGMPPMINQEGMHVQRPVFQPGLQSQQFGQQGPPPLGFQSFGPLGPPLTLRGMLNPGMTPQIQNQIPAYREHQSMEAEAFIRSNREHQQKYSSKRAYDHQDNVYKWQKLSRREYSDDYKKPVYRNDDRPRSRSPPPPRKEKKVPDDPETKALKIKIEQQKKLRQAIQRKKEARRQAQAVGRREDLAKRLEGQGLSFEEAEVGPNSISPKQGNITNQSIEAKTRNKATLNEKTPVKRTSNIVRLSQNTSTSSTLRNPNRLVRKPSLNASGSSLGLSMSMSSGGSPNTSRTVLSTSRRKVIPPGSMPSKPVQESTVTSGGRTVKMPTSTVIVESLSSTTTSATLSSLCQSMGDVDSINLNVESKSAKITFKNARHAVLFMKKYNRHVLDDSSIKVRLVKT